MINFKEQLEIEQGVKINNKINCSMIENIIIFNYMGEKINNAILSDIKAIISYVKLIEGIDIKNNFKIFDFKKGDFVPYDWKN